MERKTDMDQQHTLMAAYFKGGTKMVRKMGWVYKTMLMGQASKVSLILTQKKGLEFTQEAMVLAFVGYGKTIYWLVK
jgi:hypothetical protein